MGVTSIKQIVNQTKYPVSFLKLEDVSNRGVIQPRGFITKEVWIPWCDNASQFSSKTLILEINEDLRLYIWQRGDVVYYSKVPVKSFSTQQPYKESVKPAIHPLLPQLVAGDIFNRGTPIPGFAKVDGDRVLQIIEKPVHLLINYFDVYLQKI